MSNTEYKYSMTMDMNVLNHLGLNLYSNTSAVVSETVANSWDADASCVEITLDEDQIIIKDNGCGMNLTDINEKYLCVGHQKRIERAITPIFKRPVMGRKGIGKLSLFSIANDITILTQKDGEKNALRMTSSALIRDVKNNQSYHPEELSTELVDFEGNGTTIILRDLKKSRTTALAGHLKKRIARRFSVISAADNFDVKVNGHSITIEDREYLSKAQLLWYYLRPEKDDIPAQTDDFYLSQCKGEILKKSFCRPNQITINGKAVYIHGWIATSSEPSVLKDGDENINRIVIMVRGKMAKEDILPKIESTALYTKYIFGELHADFLDDDDSDDITTSSRQDFFDDDERYVALISFIRNEMSDIRSDWEDFRGNVGTEEACQYEVVRTWFDELLPDDKKAAKKLFGKINQLTVSASDKKTLFKHGILAFETLKLKNELSALDGVEPDGIDAFLQIAGKLEDIEATYYYQIVRQRLAVIKRMQEVVSEGALEKVIQKHLANNMWLLDPSWDRGTEAPVVEQAIKTQFDTINAGLTAEQRDARLDIRYKKAAKRHVIVELKRGNRIVKSDELIAQIMKYHDAMIKILEQFQIKDESFEIIVLLGRKLDENDFNQAIYDSRIEALSKMNTRILMYDELLRNAESLYSDYLDKHREAEHLIDVLHELDSD